MDIKSQKVWLDKNKIVHIMIEEVVTEEDINVLIDSAVVILKQFPKEGKVLITITPYEGPFIATPGFRKRIAKKVNNIIKSPGIKKVAVIGGTTIIRTVTSFIIAASGVKNMKVFGTKEEAIKWLKKP
jgi:hypothetical protein